MNRFGYRLLRKSIMLRTFQTPLVYGHGGHLYKLSFPLPKEAPQKNLALIGQAVSEEKMFENVNGRRTDGRTTDAGSMGIL